jgi:hypothetical protein
MQLQIGDWVQTDSQFVGRVESIDAEGSRVTITRVDPAEMRMVTETYSIDRLIRFEVER